MLRQSNSMPGPNSNEDANPMKRSTMIGSMATCLCLGLTAPLLAAQPTVTGTADHSSAGEANATAPKLAEKCLTDLRAFNNQMDKDGYWLGGSDYGYGYPMGEAGSGYGHPNGGYLAATAAGYRTARPGYEVRLLVATANILARHGQQQQCEDVLATTRGIYKHYLTDIHAGTVPMVDVPGWRQQQIAAALPVTDKNTSFRSDELVGTDVRDAKNQALGSVEDIVMSPQSDTIAYLVIARGGIFGFDDKYVPVPWDDFKVAPNANLLVLDTTKTAMDAAPEVTKDQFASPTKFDQQSHKVDAYWKMHLSSKGNNGTNG
jgi:sporulation protein YlmC with PRC-barrel domain